MTRRRWRCGVFSGNCGDYEVVEVSITYLELYNRFTPDEFDFDTTRTAYRAAVADGGFLGLLADDRPIPSAYAALSVPSVGSSSWCAAARASAVTISPASMRAISSPRSAPVSSRMSV